jgi:hypothetical protein
VSNSSSIVVCICRRGNLFIEPLPRNSIRDKIYRGVA